MRLWVFGERRFCWWDAGWGAFPPASPSALYRTSSMPALLSPAPPAAGWRLPTPCRPSLCYRRDPAWLPWMPGVTHASSSSRAELLCLTCTHFSLLFWFGLALSCLFVCLFVVSQKLRNTWSLIEKCWRMYANRQPNSSPNSLCLGRGRWLPSAVVSAFWRSARQRPSLILMTCS